MSKSIKDQHVLVTGASRGIGKAIATKLAANAAKITLLSSNVERLAGAENEIRTLDQDAQLQTVAADLSQTQMIPAALAQATDTFGPVEVLIHAAGVYTVAPFESADLADVDAMLDLNLKAAVHLAHAVVQPMIKVGRGAIINIGSIAGKHAFPMNTGYCASKFGLLGFTEALFADLREHGILVSYVSPGMTLTDMTRSIPGANTNKMVDPEDIANGVAWLLQTAENTAVVNLDIWPQKEVFDG